jgi:hypothetical protein
VDHDDAAARGLLDGVGMLVDDDDLGAVDAAGDQRLDRRAGGWGLIRTR